MQSDRDKEYMMAMWGTDRLVTDYVYEEKSKFLQEITDYDDKKQNLYLIRRVYFFHILVH